MIIFPDVKQVKREIKKCLTVCSQFQVLQRNMITTCFWVVTTISWKKSNFILCWLGKSNLAVHSLVFAKEKNNFLVCYFWLCTIEKMVNITRKYFVQVQKKNCFFGIKKMSVADRSVKRKKVSYTLFSGLILINWKSAKSFSFSWQDFK